MEENNNVALLIEKIIDNSDKNIENNSVEDLIGNHDTISLDEEEHVISEEVVPVVEEVVPVVEEVVPVVEEVVPVVEEVVPVVEEVVPVVEEVVPVVEEVVTVVEEVVPVVEEVVPVVEEVVRVAEEVVRVAEEVVRVAEEVVPEVKEEVVSEVNEEVIPAAEEFNNDLKMELFKNDVMNTVNEIMTIQEKSNSISQESYNYSTITNMSTSVTNSLTSTEENDDNEQTQIKSSIKMNNLITDEVNLNNFIRETSVEKLVNSEKETKEAKENKMILDLQNNLKNNFNNIMLSIEKDKQPTNIIPENSELFNRDYLDNIKYFKSNNANITDNSGMSYSNSNNTMSEFSYTQSVKKPLQTLISESEPFIKKNKKKIKSKNKITELDEIDFAYNKLQDFIRNFEIDITNFPILVVKGMEVVENLRNSDEINKKQVLIKTLHRIIMIDLDLDLFTQSFFLSNIDNLIELFIISSKSKNTIPNKAQTNLLLPDDIMRANPGQIIYSLLDKVTTIIVKKKYNSERIATNLHSIANILMMFVEKYTYLIGVEKKTIVLQTMDKLIKTRLDSLMDLDESIKENLISGFKSVNITIDIVIALQKNKYKINRRQINSRSLMDFIFGKK